MRQHYPLDSIIRKISEPDKFLSANQKLVFIDRATGKSIRNKSFLGLGKFLREIDYFLVSIDVEASDSFDYVDKMIGAGEFNLTVEYEVQVSSDSDISKVVESLCSGIHPGAELEKIIKRHLKELIREKRNKFINDFPAWMEEISAPLKERIYSETSLRVEDFQVILACEVIQAKPSVIEEIVVCKVQDYSEVVSIKNKLHMTPVDTRKYYAVGSPSLDEWARNHLKIIIPKVLFGKSIDVLFQFEKTDSHDEIKQLMKLEAQKIGYEVSQLLSVAEFKFNALMKDFTIENEGVFSLKNSSGKLEVKINIIVTAKIEKLEKVKDYLTQGITIDEFKELMKSKIYAIARRFLYKIEPDRYYLHFDYEENEQEATLEEAFKDEIRKSLQSDTSGFGATITDIVIERLDTEVSQLSKKLYKEGVSFELYLKSTLDHEETVKFTGYLQVGGVQPDCWYVFQHRMPTLDKIKEFALSSLQQHLEEKYSTQELISISNTDLQKEVSACAKSSISEQYGLEVEIKNWIRPRTESQENWSAITKEAQIAKMSGVRNRIDLLNAKQDHELILASQSFENQRKQQNELYKTRDELQFQDADDAVIPILSEAA